MLQDPSINCNAQCWSMLIKILTLIKDNAQSELRCISRILICIDRYWSALGIYRVKFKISLSILETLDISGINVISQKKQTLPSNNTQNPGSSAYTHTVGMQFWTLELPSARIYYNYANWIAKYRLSTQILCVWIGPVILTLWYLTLTLMTLTMALFWY